MLLLREGLLVLLLFPHGIELLFYLARGSGNGNQKSSDETVCKIEGEAQQNVFHVTKLTIKEREGCNREREELLFFEEVSYLIGCFSDHIGHSLLKFFAFHDSGNDISPKVSC